MNKVKSYCQQLDEWYNEQLGALIAEAEKRQLIELLPAYFGYYAVQFGSMSRFDWLKTSPITHHIGICSDKTLLLHSPFIYSSYTDLPFRNDSIDMLLLPHILEFAADPKAILHDAWRALIPEGHIIVLSFNPFSLWGLRRLFGGRKHFPWCWRFLTKFRLRQYLEGIGFEIVENQSFYFQLPLMATKFFPMLETLGMKCWPFLGSINLVVAKKPVVILTPIKQRWSLQQILNNKEIPESTAAGAGGVKCENYNRDKMR